MAMTRTSNITLKSSAEGVTKSHGEKKYQKQLFGDTQATNFSFPQKYQIKSCELLVEGNSGKIFPVKFGNENVFFYDVGDLGEHVK